MPAHFLKAQHLGVEVYSALKVCDAVAGVEELGDGGHLDAAAGKVVFPQWRLFLVPKWGERLKKEMLRALSAVLLCSWRWRGDVGWALGVADVLAWVHLEGLDVLFCHGGLQQFLPKLDVVGVVPEDG